MKKSNKIPQASRTTIASIVLLFISTLTLLYTVLYYRQHRDIVVSTLPQTPIKIDQPISIGVVSLKVSDVKTSNGVGPFVAPEDKEYILLTLTVKNRSDKPIQVLPSTDTYVKDQAGNVSYLTPFALEAPLRAGELLPGEVIKGDVSYMVDKSSTNKFYVDASWSGAVIPFSLN